MKLRRLFKNEFLALLTQGETHESLFEKEVHGYVPQPPLPEEARLQLERWHMPEIGFRNYWYPVIRSKHLKTGPIRRRLLGEDIVLWRDGGKVHALADRCLHRGASLSAGHIRFPGSGTISCPYHGWTFDGTGQLRACIQEGPDSAMPPKVRTKAYPVEERLGVVWAWIGDLAPPPIEEDLPVAMTVPGVVSFIHFTKVWNTNWALLFDNFADGLHAPYVHRTSPQFLFHKLPFRTLGIEPHLDAVEHQGKVLEMPRFASTGPPADQVEFPGLGKFPGRKWWRRLAARRR